MVLVSAAWCMRAGTVPLGIAVNGASVPTPVPFEAQLAFPGESNFNLQVPNATNWLTGIALRVSLFWPEGAPRYSGALAWLKDRDDYWHQYLTPGHLKAGETNTLTIPFQPGAAGWETLGHSLAWHHRVRLNPQSVGFRVFADAAFTGKCVLVSATLETQPSGGAPVV